MPNRSDNRLSERLRRLTGWAGFGLVVMGVVSGVGTFAIMTGLTPITPTPESVRLLLIGNGAVILLMALTVLGQLSLLLAEKRKGTAGAGLHLRLVLLFSASAVVPAILVAVFASVTLNRGLDAWFSERTRAIVDSAVNVAEAYLRDTAETTRGDVAAISADLTQQKPMFDSDRAGFVRRVARHAALRGLAGVFVFDPKAYRIDVQITANNKVEFRPPAEDAMQRADGGDLVVMPPAPGGNVVRALIKLQTFPSEYLYVYRAINPSVIDQLEKTREAKIEYDRLMSTRLGVQLTFALMYGVVGFIFLLAAIWAGLWYSDRLVAPIVRLLDGGEISLVNRSALNLLGKSESDLIGRSVAEALPAFGPLYDQATARPSGFAEGQIDVAGHSASRSYFARFTTESAEDKNHGHVLTFDDITDLVSAQRNSAWADIARRIAHEIKNPLTPIQLSAERLKRKYGNQITTDKQVFDQCTDTIIRQVGDIGRMVDEFSSFARMPKAVPERHELANVVREATVLQRVSTSDIDIELDVKPGEFEFPFDRRLVTQAVTNLVKNAREAIEGRQQQSHEPRGRILVEAGLADRHPFIRVTDNGVGLPEENRHRLAEPYMTTREKGTGLGLAIVKRIMEEHGGRLMLEDAPADFAQGLGARVTLLFDALAETVPQTA
ncbi:MAG: PAS domain-containing sensor histidine kinase [Rhizobiales bacterium]|nr:PAS domain-containing sensor histidine kinase [Hyphomicrobiales bacterium]